MPCPCPHTNVSHSPPTITHHHLLLRPLVPTPHPLGSSLVTPQMLSTTCRLPPTGNFSSARCIGGAHSTSQVESSKCPEFLCPVPLHVPHSRFYAGANGGNGWGFGRDKSRLSVAAFGVERTGGSIVQANAPPSCPSLTTIAVSASSLCATTSTHTP